jgi:hypothetical protein
VLNQSWLFFHYGVRWFLPVAEWMSINLRPPFPVTWGFPHVLGIVGYLAVLAGGAFLLLRHRDWRAIVGLALLLPALLFGTEFTTVWVQDPFVLYRSYLWPSACRPRVRGAARQPAPRAAARRARDREPVGVAGFRPRLLARHAGARVERCDPQASR